MRRAVSCQYPSIVLCPSGCFISGGDWAKAVPASPSRTNKRRESVLIGSPPFPYRLRLLKPDRCRAARKHTPARVYSRDGGDHAAVGMQHAPAFAGAVGAPSVARSSPNTGMLASVWNASQAMPCGSIVQYLSDLA